MAAENTKELACERHNSVHVEVKVQVGVIVIGTMRYDRCRSIRQVLQRFENWNFLFFFVCLVLGIILLFFP